MMHVCIVASLTDLVTTVLHVFSTSPAAVYLVGCLVLLSGCSGRFLSRAIDAHIPCDPPAASVERRTPTPGKSACREYRLHCIIATELHVFCLLELCSRIISSWVVFWRCRCISRAIGARCMVCGLAA